MPLDLLPRPEEKPTPQQTADRAETNKPEAEFGPAIEKLKAEIASAGTRIAELEKAKQAAEAVRIEAAKASADVETSKQEIQRNIVEEKARLEARIVRLEADKDASNAESHGWESALYGAVGGLVVVFVAVMVVFCINRRTESISQAQVFEPGINPIDVSGQAHFLSPDLASAEALLEVELEKQVDAINATQTISALPAPDADADGLGKVIDGRRARERVEAEEI
jgi:hypothetical protein